MKKRHAVVLSLASALLLSVFSWVALASGSTPSPAIARDAIISSPRPATTPIFAASALQAQWHAEYTASEDCWWQAPQCSRQPLHTEEISGLLGRDWGAGSPHPQLGPAWVGRFSATVDFAPGDYVFYARYGGGVKLYLDGQGILEGHPNTGAQWTCPTWHLSGTHELLAVYVHPAGLADAYIYLGWSTDTAFARCGFHFPMVHHAFSIPPTPTPTPTATPVPTPVLAWHDEFEDPALGNWQYHLRSGRIWVEDSVLHMQARDGYVETFPLMWTHVTFPAHDYILEVRFRYPAAAPYGTTIGFGSGEYEGAPVGAVEDVLSIHHNVLDFRATLLEAAMWLGTPGDTAWHTLRVARTGNLHTLSVDGVTYLYVTRSGVQPRNIMLGNPKDVADPGAWSPLDLDYIRVYAVGD